MNMKSDDTIIPRKGSTFFNENIAKIIFLSAVRRNKIILFLIP